MKINIPRAKIEAKVQDAFNKGLPLLCEEILNDCNEYCKWQEGDLAASAQTHSKPTEGKLIWQTAYARRQYWEIPTAYKDHHPNASWKWCEVAKRNHKEQWARQAQALFERNL